MSRAVSYRPNTGAKDDRYFMLPHINEACATTAQEWIVEFNLNPTGYEDPCAGSGEMTRHWPGAAAYDLNPEPNQYGIEIKQRDFFKHTQPYTPGLFMIMNVPYGYGSNAAIAFVNHAADYADYLLVVVPATWERGIYDNRINPYFHKVASKLLPENAFYLPDNNNKVHDVPSVMQLWVRKDTPRAKTVRRTASDIIEVRRNKGSALHRTPDVAIRRQGISAKSANEIITKNFNELTKDNYFYIFIKKGLKRKVMAALRNIDWMSIASTNMTVPGINKTHVINLVEQYIAAR